MPKFEPNIKQEEAIHTITSELSEWGKAEVWVIPKLMYNMNELVKKSRMNYLGIYKNDKDPTTGRQKIFVPLTEWTIDNGVKNFQLDQKNITTQGRHQGSYLQASLFRYILQNFLDRARFGKTLNTLATNIGVDGTGILKAWKDNGELNIALVDRTNIISDPSAPTLDDSSAVIERNILTMPEFQTYKEWADKDVVKGDKNFSRYDFNGLGEDRNQKGETPYVTVHERYGYLPKFVFTGNEADKDEYVYTLSVYSGLTDKAAVVHQIKMLPEPKKGKAHPYQEFKYKEVQNRFDGRGMAEIIFDIQAYVNETVNLRLNTGRIVQSGLWRVGGNVTPQQLKKLFTTGAIKTNSDSDIQRLDTGSIDPSSYQDEDQAYQWSQRVTNTTPGDEVAASKPATNALIQEKEVNKGFNFIIQNISLNMEKFMEEKVVPIIKDLLTDDDVIRITGDANALKELQEPFIENKVQEDMEQEFNEKGYYTQPIETQEEVLADFEARKQEEIQNQQKKGDQRFVEIKKEFFDTDFDVKINVADEQINRALVVQNMQSIIGTLGQLGVPVESMSGSLIKMFDAMGEDGASLVAPIEKAASQPLPPEALPPQPGQPQPQGQQGLAAQPIPPTPGQALNVQ